MKKKSLNRFVFKIYLSLRSVIKVLIPGFLREKLKRIFLKSIDEIKINIKSKEKFESGINLIGFITAETGLGHGCRLLAEAIEQTGINWLAIDFNKALYYRYNDKTWINRIEKVPKYNINIFHINPDAIYYANMYLPESIWSVPYNIGFFLWELPELPDDWVKSIDLFDEIWAPSYFVVDTIKKYTKKPVIKIPYGIIIKDYDKFDRTYFGFSETAFLFLIMYDVQSTAERKNPLGAVMAYKEAFTPDMNDVGLVIKINNKHGKDREIQDLKKTLKDYPNIYFIEKTLDRNEVNSLINCVDSFVSLHRSEGFGLVVAEAMYLGKPVIATNYSANTDFMNYDNSCPVDFEMITIEAEHGPYKKGQIWADPDCFQAAGYMQKLKSDNIYYDQISASASVFIRNNLTIQNSAQKMLERLAQIKVGSI